MPAHILCGDAFEVLKSMADESVHCCVTSPPYYGLRDYDIDGQLGLESSPLLYVERLVSIFRQVKRVLRSDGTLWLNLGDSYCAPNGRSAGNSYENKGPKSQLKHMVAAQDIGIRKKFGDAKPKDLLGIPWRVAFALQDDGWYLRQDIIWAKPNPMPESVKDRCTKSHEHIFLLSKSAKYFYDAEALKEPCSPGNVNDFLKRKTLNNKGDHGGTRKDLSRSREDYMPEDFKRNRRDVWTITTRPYPAAHFAVFPPTLPELCIQAGCPEDATVLDPFHGAGTTGLVALRLGREYIGIELNPEYVELSKKRIYNDAPLFNGSAMN